MLKAKDLKDHSIEELQATLLDVRRELFNLKNQRKQNSLEKPHLLREKKKDVARLCTVIRKKQIASS